MKTNLITLISVNIAEGQTIQTGRGSEKTGIYKTPTVEAVSVTELGLTGDVIGSKKHHGGVDQAVYIYSQEDYDWWAGQLDREMPPGMFGENLTVAGVDFSGLRIGDRMRVGEALLEVTSVRIPCSKLENKMERPGFLREFVGAARPGVYARVLETGAVKAGDKGELLPTEAEHPLALDLFHLWYVKQKDPDLVRRLLDAPVAERARARLEQWAGTAV